MMSNFLKSEIGPIILFLTMLLTIWLSFLLFDISMEAFGVLFWLLFIIMGVYLTYKAVNFKKQTSFEERLEEVEAELVRVKEDGLRKRTDLEEYFIMWVHQMKTPITASQLVLANPDEDALPKLRQEMLYIENYTNMALNYLKISNPTTDMVISKRSLDDILSPIIRKYRSQFIQKKIRLHYQVINSEVVTEANLTSLMIEQLLNNALKYTDQGDIWIQFNSETYQLEIKDSGRGIKVEDLPKIFDKGYSGFNGQLNQKSSGIGLYLVKLISQRLDQEVNVQSTLNQGTSFTIQFHRDIQTYNIVR